MKLKLELFEGDTGWWVVNDPRSGETEWSINFDNKQDAMAFMVTLVMEIN